MSKWKVPFIDLPREYSSIETPLLDSIRKLMGNGRFVLGDKVEAFEDNMASYLEVEHVIGVNSGTDALFLALRALGIGPGDEVITVAHTFAATVAVIKHLGATPILVDVDLDNYNMDTLHIEERITDKTKVILPVHLNGRCCDMDIILALAEKYNLEVVEDACQALGATYKGKMAGSFGIGCFSCHPLKTLSAMGDGGYISLSEDILDYDIRQLRNHGTFDKVRYGTWGYNSRLDEIQALVLSIKLPHLSSYINKRREVAQLYSDSLSGLCEVKTPIPPLFRPFYDTYNAYVIRVEKRDKLRRYLTGKGIETLVNWEIPLYMQEGLELEHYIGRLPNTERLSKEVLNLPIHPWMEYWEVDYVVECIKEFYG